MTELPLDFKELLAAFADFKIEYLLVGVYAVMAHGLTRATEDFNLWVRPTAANAQRAWGALEFFGAPMGAWKVEDFSTPGQVLFFGKPPLRIDLLTSISGVEFDQAWAHRTAVDIEGTVVPLIHLDELILNKQAAGREKDLLDARLLTAIRDQQRRTS